MRIGLGKVLLKDQNLLLLGEFPLGIGSFSSTLQKFSLIFVLCFMPRLSQMNLQTIWI
jgi:hypothetical protein